MLSAHCVTATGAISSLTIKFLSGFPILNVGGHHPFGLRTLNFSVYLGRTSRTELDIVEKVEKLAHGSKFVWLKTSTVLYRRRRR